MEQTGTKRIHVLSRLGGKGDPQGSVQKTKVWSCWKMVYESALENMMYEIRCDFDHPISTRRPGLVFISKKKNLII